MAEWINVKDRLPEDENHVLAAARNKRGEYNIVKAYYSHDLQTWAAGMNSNVTHWMPLPEPPVHRKAPTNGDRLRSMSDEEFAEVIWGLGACDTCALYHRGCATNRSCKDTILEWLKKEVKEDDPNDRI